MKAIILALLLASCATTRDPLQEQLAEHVTYCMCLLKKGTSASYQVNWKDKNNLNDQVESCKCTVEFRMSEVDEPRDYIKPGTKFYVPQHAVYPWDPDYVLPTREVQ